MYVYGRAMVGWDLPITLEFAVLTLASALTVIAIHEGLVRRFAIVRLLFNGKTDIGAVRKEPGLLEAFGVSAMPRTRALASGT